MLSWGDISDVYIFFLHLYVMLDQVTSGQRRRQNVLRVIKEKNFNHHPWRQTDVNKQKKTTIWSWENSCNSRWTRFYKYYSLCTSQNSCKSSLYFIKILEIFFSQKLRHEKRSVRQPSLTIKLKNDNDSLLVQEAGIFLIIPACKVFVSL